MTDIESFVEWLNSELDNKGWSYSELARRGGITHTSISKIINERQQPGLKVARGIAKALDIPLEVILRKTGILPSIPAGVPGQTDDTLVSTIAMRASQLDEKGQRAILEMLTYLLTKQEEDTDTKKK